MLRNNPRALSDHVLWNFRMVPAGLQLLLFDCASGGQDPDYKPVRVHALFASVGSGLLIAVLWPA